MQFGFNLPNSGALATPEIMSRIAGEGEALGYDYLTVTDHVALPDMAEPGYPGRIRQPILIVAAAILIAIPTVLILGNRAPKSASPIAAANLAEVAGDFNGFQERRAELDALLRAELESQGIVVSGHDVARVVSSAAGQRIAWAG